MNNKFNKILFDLDGTLSDSREGIVNSLRYAFDKMEKEQPGEDVLNTFLGPPLWDSFRFTMGYTEAEAEAAVRFYRERFIPLGIYENRLYPGVEDLLHRLSQRRDVQVYLATSKPEPFALKVLEYFKIRRFFDDVGAATLDDAIRGKTQVITSVLDRNREGFDPERTLMVGDRDHDVNGAKDNGIRCAGAVYGYGSAEELKGADYLVHDVEELKQLLLGGK